VTGQIESFHHCVRDFHARQILVGDQMGRYLQTSCRFGFTDVLQGGVKRPQRATGPGLANLAEEPMFDWIPFGGACRIMADDNRQAKAVGHLVLQLVLPHPGASAVAPSTVGFNHHLGGVRETLQALGRTPLGDVVYGKGRGIRRTAQIHGAAIVLGIIKAIGNRPPQRVLFEVVDIHDLRALAPDLAGVLEIPDQLLLFRVHADNRLTGFLMLLPLLPDIGKLAIPLRMLLAAHLLVIGFQRIVMGFEQAADHGFTDALFAQVFLNVAQPTVEPLAAAHRVARRVGRNDFQQPCL